MSTMPDQIRAAPAPQPFKTFRFSRTQRYDLGGRMVTFDLVMEIVCEYAYPAAGAVLSLIDGPRGPQLSLEPPPKILQAVNQSSANAVNFTSQPTDTMVVDMTEELEPTEEAELQKRFADVITPPIKHKPGRKAMMLGSANNDPLKAF